MRTNFGIAAVLLLGLGAATAQASVAYEGYWDFNSNNLVANPAYSQPGVTMTLSGLGGLTGQGYFTGTTLNAVGATPAGSDLSFYTIAEIFKEWDVNLLGFDFTGREGGAISLAVKSDNLFDVGGEDIEIAYQINGGGYTTFGYILGDLTEWGAFSFDIPDAVDGQSNVDFRIRASGGFEIFSFTDYDNITITSIPEPASAMLLAGAAILTLRRGRRGGK